MLCVLIYKHLMSRPILVTAESHLCFVKWIHVFSAFAADVLSEPTVECAVGCLCVVRCRVQACVFRFYWLLEAAGFYASANPSCIFFNKYCKPKRLTVVCSLINGSISTRCCVKRLYPVDGCHVYL